MKLIKNGRIATDTEVFNGDILIDGEKIIEIGECINADGAEVIDASGKYVIPGAVDVHTHMDLVIAGAVLQFVLCGMAVDEAEKFHRPAVVTFAAWKHTVVTLVIVTVDDVQLFFHRFEDAAREQCIVFGTQCAVAGNDIAHHIGVAAGKADERHLLFKHILRLLVSEMEILPDR